MGEQASLEFDLTFGDVLLHKLVQAYKFNTLRYTLYILYQSENDSDSIFQYLMIVVANGYENTKNH